MIGLREYPPGAVFHIPSCPDVADSAPSLPVLQAVAANPSHRYCVCTGGGPDDAPQVVIERVDYGPHLYGPSPNRPRDATRALCRTCRGTHGQEATTPPDLLVSPWHGQGGSAGGLVLP
jgi:hypothetical protein